MSDDDNQTFRDYLAYQYSDHRTEGWVCYDQKNVPYMKSFANTREESLKAYLGYHWEENWPEAEARGHSCLPVIIAPDLERLAS